MVVVGSRSIKARVQNHPSTHAHAHTCTSTRTMRISSGRGRTEGRGSSVIRGRTRPIGRRMRCIGARRHGGHCHRRAYLPCARCTHARAGSTSGSQGTMAVREHMSVSSRSCSHSHGRGGGGGCWCERPVWARSNHRLQRGRPNTNGSRPTSTNTSTSPSTSTSTGTRADASVAGRWVHEVSRCGERVKRRRPG